MTPATAQKPLKAAPEPSEPAENMTLFLPDDYEVTSHKISLGGINVDGDGFDGIKVGDEFDVTSRVKVTGVKWNHKGEASLILTGDNLRVVGAVVGAADIEE